MLCAVDVAGVELHHTLVEPTNVAVARRAVLIPKGVERNRISAAPCSLKLFSQLNDLV